jgi:hypothetical protein
LFHCLKKKKEKRGDIIDQLKYQQQGYLSKQRQFIHTTAIALNKDFNSRVPVKPQLQRNNQQQ